MPLIEHFHPKNSRQSLLRFLDTLIAASVVWLAIATLGGWLGEFYWSLDLLAHFKVQYFCVGLLLLVFLIVRRSWLWLGACVVLTLINGYAISPFWFGKPLSPATGAVPFKMLVFNVYSGGSSLSRKEALAPIEVARPEIILLLETNWQRWGKAVTELEDFGYKLLAHTEDNGEFDMSLLSTIPEATAEVLRLTSRKLPAINVQFVWEGKPASLLAIHPMPPTSEAGTRARDAYLEDVGKWAIDQHSPVIIAGDFNTTPWGASFRHLMAKTGLKNSQMGFGIQATWCDSCGLLRIPIDHVIYSSDFTCVSRKVGVERGASDHNPIWLELAWSRLHTQS